MEILHKHALAPGLHNAVAAAVWSGRSSSSTAAVGGRSTSSSGRNCRTTLPPLPNVMSLPRGLGCPSPVSLPCTTPALRDGLSTSVYYAPQRGRVAPPSRAEHNQDFSQRAQFNSVVEVGAFSEGFERFLGVLHLRKCGGRCRGRAITAVSSLNGNEGNVNLEVEVFRFMQQSGKPDAFPTRQDLVRGGRTDLVKAIEEEGSWLAAGWERENEKEADRSSDDTLGGEISEKESSHPKRSRRKFRARSLKRSSSTTVGKSSRVRMYRHGQGIAERRLDGSNVVRKVVNAVDDEDGRMIVAGRRATRMLNIDDSKPLDDFPILERAQQLPYKEKSAVVQGTKKPSERVTTNDDHPLLERLSSLLSFTEELEVRRPQRKSQWGSSLGQDFSARNDFPNGSMNTTISSQFFSENGFSRESLLVDVPVENSVPDPGDDLIDVAAAVPKRKRNFRKKERAKVVEEKCPDGEVDGTPDWINSLFDKREKWMLESRSRSVENSFGASVVADSKSMQNRIHRLAANLADTRAALQSGREALRQTDDDQHVNQEALSEFVDVEDTLELRENAIMHVRNALKTTRAQVAALEGKMNVEIMEAREILEEKNRQTERARSAFKHLRTARIVWHNYANEVFLTGSFNGWNGQIKMDRSSAGVFSVSLPLYPGRYEIKFVVDGSWRVDTQRPIVYIGGFENNVLTVS